MKEEITKEIKNLDELETTNPVQKEIEEIIEEEEEKPEIIETTEEKVEETKEKKPLNKKLFMIIGGIVLALIIIIVMIILLSGKKDKKEETTKKNNDSPFVTTIKESLKSGDFDEAIENGLSNAGIKADTVCILNMDIDSDKDQELVVYAEEGSKKGILQLEVDTEVTYDDHYLLDAKDSIGYVYSSDKNSNFWYTELTKNYTIISSAKKIIKEEDFLNDYFALTKTYKEKAILDYCTEYKFDKKLNAKQLEKAAITNEMFEKDNKIDEKDIKAEYDKYIKEKEEKEKKEKEEAAAKAKAEEDQKKLAGILKLGNYSYKYGTYNIYTPDGELDGTMVLYADLTCTHKGVSCTFNVGEVIGSNNELVPGIKLSTGQSYTTTIDEGVLLEPNEAYLAKYAG